MARGRRGRAARIAAVQRDIDRAADRRRDAFAEGNQPNLTERLSAELDGPDNVRRPEGLFAQKRGLSR